MLPGCDYLETDETGAFSVLDVLPNWGRAHLFEPEDAATLAELAAQWEELIGEADGLTSLAADLQILTGQVQQALEVLQSPQALKDMTEYTWQVQAAMEALDYVVFLSEALEYLPSAGSLPEGLREGAEALLRRVTVDHEPSGLRLIPLNDWRRQVLERIPANRQYLFPWYASWADVPSDTLELVIEEWTNLSQGYLDLEGLEEGTLSHLLAELRTDQDLLDHLRKEASLAELIPRAVEQSVALRLFSLGSKQGALTAVPETVRKAGLAACASRAIKGRLRSEADRMERLFRAAFCGPFLTDGQRIELLSEVEKSIKTIDPSSLGPGSDLALLHRWSQGKMKDEMLATTVFNRWTEDLRAASKALGETTVEEASRFWDAVHAVREQPLDLKPKRIIDGPLSWWKRLRGPRTIMPVPEWGLLAAACLVVMIGISGLYELHRPPIHASLGLTGKPGLADVRSGRTEVQLRPGDVLRSGDAFKINVRVDKQAYVYILLHGSTGKLTKIFSGKLEAGSDVSPGDPRYDNWYKLDENKGKETIYLIISQKAFDDFDRKIIELQNIDFSEMQTIFPNSTIQSFTFTHE